MRFSSDPQPFVAGADAIIAKLKELDKLVDKIEPKLRLLPQGFAQNMPIAINGMQRLTSHMASHRAELQRLEQSMRSTADAMNAMVSGKKQITAASAGAAASTINLTGAIQGLAGTYTVYQTLRQLVGQVASAIEDARSKQHQWGAQTNTWGDTLREIAVNRGQPGPNQLIMAGQKQLLLAAGASPREAMEYEQMWESTVNQAKLQKDAQGAPTWQLNAAEEAKLKTQTLQYAIASNLDPRTAAQTVGSFAINQTIRSADEGLGLLNASTQMQQLGQGDMTQLFQAAGKIRGAMVSEGGGAPFQSIDEMIAVYSAVTANQSPERAKTSMTQLWREANRKAASDLGFRAGKSSYLDAVKMFKRVIDAGAAKGRTAQESLQGAGFSLSWANTSIETQVKELPLMESQLGMIRGLRDPNAVRERIQGFYQTTTGASRMSAAAQFVSEREASQGMEVISPLLQSAQAQMRSAGQIDTTGSNIQENINNWMSMGLARNDWRTARSAARLAKQLQAINPRKAATIFPNIKDSQKDEDIIALNMMGEDMGAAGKRMAGVLTAAEYAQLNASFLAPMAQRASAEGASATQVQIQGGDKMDAAADKMNAAADKFLQGVRPAGIPAAQGPVVGMRP